MRIGLDARMIGHSGIGTYVQGLLGGFQSLPDDHRWVVFVPPAGRSLVPADPRFEIRVATTPVYGLRERTTWALALAGARCDVVHVPHYNIPWFPPRRTVVTVHDAIHVLFPEFVAGRGRAAYARLLLSRAVRRAAALVTDSEATRADLALLFGALPGRCIVVPPGIDPAFRPPDPAAVAAFRDRNDLARPYVLYVGLLRPHKNVVRLVDAFERAAPGLGAAMLVVRGGRDRRYPAIIAALERGVAAGRVRWLETPVAAGDMPLLYAGARVVACPSLSEGFGLPVLEAMGCGTPVVAAQAGALPEVAGDAALFADPEDTDALARALAIAFTDAGVRARLVDAGSRRASRYDWSTCARSLVTIYEEVAVTNRPAPTGSTAAAPSTSRAAGA